MKKANTTLSNSQKSLTIPLIVFILLYILLYGQLLTDFFAFMDDDVYFTNNPYIKSLSAENIGNMFTRYYEGNYHPITSLLEAMEYALFGLTPKSYHLISFLFHFINSLLVFRLVRKLSGQLMVAYIVCFVFAFHPMHVETVGWITDQTDIFMAFFAILALGHYERFLKSGSYMQYGLSFLMFLLALGSKPSAIAIPPVLFLMDYLAGKRLFEKWWLKLPYILAALCFAVITFLSLDAKGRIAEELIPEYAIWEKFFVVNYALAYYFFGFLFPFDLSLLHLAEQKLSWTYYASPLLNLSVFYFFYRWFKKDRLVPAGFLFFLVNIFLVLQILPSGFNVVCDRYTYFPFIGLSLALAVILFHEHGNSLPAFIRSNRMMIVIMFGLMFLVLNYQYGRKWTSLYSLAANTTVHNPHAPYAWIVASNYAIADNKLDEAIEFLDHAEELDDKNPDLFFMRGKVDYIQKNLPASLKNFEKARQYGSARKDLIDFLGVLYFENNQFDSAAACFSKVIARDTVFVAANYRNRAISYYNLEKYPDAIKDYDLLLAKEPGLLNLYGERGICYGKMSNNSKACEDLRKAVAGGYEDFRADLQLYCE